MLAGLLLVAAGLGAAYWRLDPDDVGLPGLVAPGPEGRSSAPPSVEPAPEELEVTPPTPAVPDPVAEPLERPDAGTADPVAVRRALRQGLADPALGPHVVARVAGLADGRAVMSSGRPPFIPASTLKLLTAAAALETLGPDHVFETRVVEASAGEIVLVGGGDPTLAARPASGPEIYPVRPDLQALAAETARAVGRGSSVRLTYDDSLFTGPSASPHWESDYVPDEVVAPISALWVDGGRPPAGYGRVADPPAAAAAVFARALERRGVTVTGPVRPAATPATGAELAVVDSAPLEQIVERILETSDNEGAEVLLRHVGQAQSGRASFAGGTAGVRSALGSLGIPLTGARLYDGSGLSRDNRLDPATLVAVLRTAADASHPELRTVLSGLPVAGATGTLGERFTDDARPGRGMVRAKTGTLSSVSSLAGLVTDRDGVTMVFVLAADRFDEVDTLSVRSTLDELAADLAGCRCALPPGG